MAERQSLDQQHPLSPQLQSPSPPREDMIACVMALEAALLPCLPARELQAIDRSPHPSHQTEAAFNEVIVKLDGVKWSPKTCPVVQELSLSLPDEVLTSHPLNFQRPANLCKKCGTKLMFIPYRGVF